MLKTALKGLKRMRQSFLKRPRPMKQLTRFQIDTTSTSTKFSSGKVPTSGRHFESLRVSETGCPAEKFSSVNIVNYDGSGWILERIAGRLSAALRSFGLDVAESSSPLPGFDIVHHIPFQPVKTGSAVMLDSVMVTHLDTADKRNRVAALARQSIQAIAMSSQTAQIINQRLRGQKGLRADHALAPSMIERSPRVAIGLFFRIYDDGRKRQELVLKLTQAVGGENLHFLIMGSGWEGLVDLLRNERATVEWRNAFDSAAYPEWLHRADFVLFTGLDEGAIGFLDALAVGTRVIVPPIGYHVDYRHELIHYARSVAEMAEPVTSEIHLRQSAFSMVADPEWQRYSYDHVSIWERALTLAPPTSRQQKH